MTDDSANNPRTLIDVLRARAESDGDRIGYVFLRGGVEPFASLTFSDLDRRARAIAEEIRRHAAVGARALLPFPAGLDFVAAFFGCLYAGVIAVPAPPISESPSNPAAWAAAARTRAVIEDCRPDVVLCTEADLSRLDGQIREAAGLNTVVDIPIDLVDLGQALRWQRPAITALSTAYLQYSSGSTGSPKGVVLTHQNVLHNLRAICDVCTPTRETTAALWLPTFHDMGLISGVISPAYSGCRAEMMSPMAFVQRPYTWLAALSRPDSVTAAPNFAFDLCVDRVKPDQLRRLDLSGWRHAIVGAERVRPSTLQRFADTFGPCGFRPESFLPCYGLAESTLMVTAGSATGAPTVRHFDLAAMSRGLLHSTPGPSRTAALVGNGRPCGDSRVLIADPTTHRAMPNGEIGEVLVASDSVGTGYWHEQRESAGVFGIRVPGSDSAYLRTGDLGGLVDGELFITGRLKDVLKVDGSNHFPQDLETTAENADRAVRPGHCAVVSVDGDRTEQLVVLAELTPMTLRGGVSQADHERITLAIRRAIVGRHCVAVGDVKLLRPGALPFTSSGKLQRFACRAEYLAGHLDPFLVVEPIDDEEQVAS